MASSFKICAICKQSFNYTCGAFSQHLISAHQISLKDYIINYELNGITPKCKCGFCDEEPPFVRGKFLKFIGDHKTYAWFQSHYIEKFGVPTCKTCGKEIGFNRLKPFQYCSHKCEPGKWNQKKIKLTLKVNYGVENPMQIDNVKEKISVANKASAKSALKKRKNTCQEKYGVNSVMHLKSSIDKLKLVCLQNHGVDHIFKTDKNRIAASLRAKENNPAFNLKNIKTIKYKDTLLTYQSGYEYHFLELCESLHLLHRIRNGNFYKYTIDKTSHNMMTDFSIDDTDIEIKSTWVLKKQGGLLTLFAKKEAVENTNRKYLFILDKDYLEFINNYSK